MNLPFFKRFKKKVLPSYYLVLILRDDKAHAVIFEELEGQAKIVGQREQYFPTTIDETPPQEFLETLDKAISSAESSLPENVQTQKTIFGVKESWTDKDQIKKEYLAKLKKASEELELIPIGFLVISQAISHLLQKEEGVPISAILVEVNKKNLTVTLWRAGRCIETKSSAIHDSIPFTVDTLLKHFRACEILPSRVIVFNGKEDLSQDFITHTWSKSLPFLHIPQVTSLPEGFDAKSVLFGAATQLGVEISEKDIPQESTAIDDASRTEEKIEKEEDEEEDAIEQPEYKNLEAQNFGFAKDIDVAKIPTPQEEELQSNNDLQQDYADEKLSEENIVDKKTQDTPQFEEEIISAKTKTPKGFTKILNFLRKIFLSVLGLIFLVVGKAKVKETLSHSPKGKVGIIVVGILIFIIGSIVCYFLFLKATVEITIDPQILEQNKNIIFSTTQGTNQTENIIQGEIASISEDGSVSTPATGKKDVGTYSKGTVTVFNATDEDQTLQEGAIITSPNGLEFTLDQSITIKGVASHSADESPTPQTMNVNVTAEQLGKESNLPSGTKFSVGSYDKKDIVAKNDNPFSGGTKKQITVASANDAAKLENDLIKQLESKANEDLQRQVGQDRNILPTFISEEVSKKSLNVKIGDETNQLTLTGTAEYQKLAYNKNDIIEFSKSFLSKDLSPNQTIDFNNLKVSVLDIKNTDDGDTQANLNIKALLLPKLDQNKLIKEMKRKSFKFTEDMLYKLPQIADVRIKLSPSLPFLPKNLPAREGNIELITKLNE